MQIFSDSKNLRVIIFALSFIVLSFWVIGNSVDVYSSAILGVLFEVLSLPMLALLFVIPIISINQIRKYKAGLNSLPFYSILIIILTVILLAVIPYSKSISV